MCFSSRNVTITRSPRRVARRSAHRLPSLLHVTEVHQHCGHALSPVVKEMLHGANPPPKPQVHAHPQTRTQANGHSQISHELRAASHDFSGVQRIETKGKNCSMVTGNTKQCLCWCRGSIFYDARFLHNRTTNTSGQWRATSPTPCLDLIYGGSDDIHGNENNTFRPPAQPAVCSHLQRRAMPLPVAGWSVFRTQTMSTAASDLGTVWWMEGVCSSMQANEFRSQTLCATNDN